MRMRFAAALVLAAGVMARAQSMPTDTRAETSKLIALENAWNQAQIHRDGEALNAIVTDSFIYTDWDGTLYNKAQFIASAKDTSVQTTTSANQNVEVHFYPGVAIVAGEYHTTGKNRGKPFDHYGRFTDTWIELAGKWQCVASHSNRMQKPANAHP